MTAERRDPTLDGLRGLAIALVMLFHFTRFERAHTMPARLLTMVPAIGWSGVDLFFVLSGFLITGILIRSRKSVHYYRTFYARRVLRIFPLYYAVLLFFLVILPRLPLGIEELGEIHVLGKPDSGVWYWLFLSNVRAAWLGVFPHSMLGVTWSLAVEEHFYLFWPFVVRLCSDRALLRVCGTIAVGALAARIACVAFGDSILAAYVSTPCRLDALAAGAALAILARRPGGLAAYGRAASVALFACIGAFALLCVGVGWIDARRTGATPTLDESFLTGALGFAKDPIVATAGFSLLWILYASLVVVAVTAPAGAVAARLFRVDWLCALGRYSYALYLFHMLVAAGVFPVFAEQAPRPGLFGITTGMFWLTATGVTYALARISWAAFEGPILRLKRHFPYVV